MVTATRVLLARNCPCLNKVSRSPHQIGLAIVVVVEWRLKNHNYGDASKSSSCFIPSHPCTSEKWKHFFQWNHKAWKETHSCCESTPWRYDQETNTQWGWNICRTQRWSQFFSSSIVHNLLHHYGHSSPKSLPSLLQYLGRLTKSDNGSMGFSINWGQTWNLFPLMVNRFDLW